MNLVYYPDKLYNGIITNAYSNAKRSSWIIKGREADETHNPKPKRTKTETETETEKGIPSNASSVPGYFKEDPAKAKADGGGPAQFTPINQVQPRPPKPKNKKRGKMDLPNGVYFLPDSKAPTTQPISTPEATVTTTSSVETPIVGVAATVDDNPNSTADPTQTNNLAETSPADNVRPGTTNEPGLSLQLASIFDPDVAECVEALALLRSGTYIPHMNEKYKT